ncbi:MAG: MBL fold metallo-hydrolase, partial [Bdellovibrionales bacterium]|nr:MBL fold metallo-hydrolase [Bdellovibrionales bacterium]
MKLTFWGVRGSIPTPGPNTVRYGGNTTCLEIRTPSDELIILDGGSGIRELGMKLLGQLPIKANVFISHTHWDHIQGLPFFVPFFIPGQEISIHGTFDPVYQKDLQSILSAQMEYCYFPVRSNELKANITYNDLREQQGVELESAKVCGILMNHPVMTFGYRIDCGEKSIFFTGDHENPTNI